jgi:hypothetical protein
MGRETKGEKFGKVLLEVSRNLVRENEYDNERFPDWLDSAKVSIGHLHRTTVFVFSPSFSAGDEFEFEGEVTSIIELIADIPDEHKEQKTTPPHAPAITPEGHQGIHLMGGGSGEGKSPIIELTMDSPNMFDVRTGHHVPFVLTNMLVRFSPDASPIATGYIPFAFCVHDYDFENLDRILEIFEKNISDYLSNVYTSQIGDYYKQRATGQSSLVTSKEDSVIVLGDYDGGKHEKELLGLRDELEAEGYHASLIKELPAHPSQSLPQKVKMWCLTSRFVVLVDRKPSGHIREYTELSKEEIPLALFKEYNTGSTFMIGHEHHTDDFIEVFEFESSPGEVTTEAIEWAEEFIDELAELYKDTYPWRGN